MKQSLILLALTFSFQAFAEIEIGDKELFGKYLREQITDTSKAPYNFVGKIGTSCTATLIGPKHIITAGHCVFDYNRQEWMTYLFFTPRQIENGEYPFGRIKAKKIYLQKEFTEKADPDYDFAVIELAEAIGDKVGWADLQIVTNKTSLKKIRITGYPQDEILDTMWSVSCPATIKASRLAYNCDTYNGMSGSGIFSSETTGAKELIYGIHSYATEESNGGVIINQRNFEIINSWKNGTQLPPNTLTR